MALAAMMEAARELPDQLRKGTQAAEAVAAPVGPFNAAVVVGMGGSSIGGALAARLIEGQAQVPLTVVRDHTLPGFVDEATLVVATSYSGSTAETLDATRHALDAGASLAAVTTGGELGPLVESAGGPVVEVPTGYQPRAAVGWLLAANHTLLSRALEIGSTGALAQAAKRLSETLPDIAEEGGPADALAEGIGDGPVGVVGHDLLGAVARRWAAELAENAKRLAFHAELPEMAHNQVVGWDGEPGDATLITLRRDQEAPLEAARLSFLAERAEQAGATVLEAELSGDGIDAVLEAVLLGDLVSLHLARREGIDPEPVDVIDALKDRLADAEP